MHGRGAKEVMMFDFSQYDLDELYEAKDALEKEIQDKEFKLRDIAFEQEDMQLEEQLEEWRDSQL
jgi:FtsZ-binding cell division protein ZapB